MQTKKGNRYEKQTQKNVELSFICRYCYVGNKPEHICGYNNEYRKRLKSESNNAGASLNFALKILMLGFVFSIVYHGMAKFLNKIFGVVNNKNNENT